MNELYQTQYTGIDGKSYITFKIPATEELKEYQIEMLSKNSIEYLLPLTIRRINNDYIFSYEITSKISLGKLLERKNLGSGEFEYVIKQIGQLSSLLNNYLLDIYSILYEKYCIYCDPANLSLYFIYLPVQNNDFDTNEIRDFLQKLIVEDIRLQDDSSGTLLKKLLDTLKADAFSPEKLLLCINEKSIQEQITHNQSPDYEDRQEVKPNDYPEENDYMSQSDYTKLNDYISQKERIKQKRQNNNPYTNPKPPQQHHTPTKQGMFLDQKDLTHKQQDAIARIDSKLSYPLNSYLIAGAVNITFIGILIYVLFASENTKNLLTTIFGLALIGFAINYFLFTRLFSQEKRKVTNKDNKDKTMNNKYTNNSTATFPDRKVKNNAATSIYRTRAVNDTTNSYAEGRFVNSAVKPFKGKRFINDDMEEDIILPKINSFNNRARIQQQKVNDIQSYKDADMQNDREIEIIRQRDTEIQSYRDADIQRQKAYETKSQNGFQMQRQLGNEISENSSIDSNESTLKEESSTNATLQNRIGVASQNSIGAPPQSSINATLLHDESISDNTIILGTPLGDRAYLQSHSCPSEKIIISKPSLLMGRLADSVDYIIRNNAVGKIHSEIVKKDESYFIIDLNSVNGTYINNERIVCNTEAKLKNGDIITLANESYTFVG